MYEKKIKILVRYGLPLRILNTHYMQDWANHNMSRKFLVNRLSINSHRLTDVVV